ncbi:immunoglobulin-like domain-containing protein [Bacteroidota bacterium]
MKINILQLIAVWGFTFMAGFGYSQQYCTPTSNCMVGTIVDFSTTGGSTNISNNSSGCSNNGFEYFYNKVLVAQPGDTIVFSVGNIAPYYQAGYAIWMDWNNDFDFTDAGESLWNSGTYKNGIITDTVFIPSSVSFGQHRMRVMSSYYAMPSNPCTNGYYGETEDYPVIIVLGSGLDLGMEKLLTPSVFKTGNNTIKVQARNYGAVAVSSFTLGYMLDNNTPEIDSFTNQSLGLGSSFMYEFSKPMNVSSSGTHTMKIFLGSPNGISPDSIRNDTIVINFCTGMSGAYTIGATGDFSSIASAIAAMQSCGVSDTVVFTLRAGTYNGPITIPNFQGSHTMAKPVIFNGVNKSNVTITSSTAGTTSGTLVIDGAAYITFKNIKIQNTSSGVVVNLLNNADLNVFENCEIVGGSYGIYSNNSEADYNYIKNSLIRNNNTGVYLVGLSTSKCIANKLIGNTFTGQSNAIYTRYQQYCFIQNNSISNLTSASSIGVLCLNNSGTQMDGNIISPGGTGIDVQQENYLVSDSSVFVNNIIGNFNSSTNQKGMNFYYSWNCRVYHNTIAMSYTGNVDSVHAGIVMSLPLGNKIKNNILYTTGKNVLISIIGTYYPSYVQSECDYNLFYSGSNGAKFFNKDTYYNDLAGFKTSTNYFFSGHDAHSFYQINPNFVSTSNFHLSANYKASVGEMLNIPKDVDGDLRCAYAATIGADESPYNTGKPVAGFSVNDTVCYNSPVTFSNHASASEPYGHQWYINNVYLANTLNFTYTFANLNTSYNIMLITSSCGGKDTATKTVYTSLSNSSPNAGFLASKNIINPYDEVKFYSMSPNCPSSWKWKITPEYVNDPYLGMVQTFYYVNFTSKYSQNPQVKFEYSGKYSVCMTVSNTVGSDSLCFSDYIYVIPIQHLCEYVLPDVQNSLTGILYDDGGPTDYSINQNCDMLLTPCADTILFTFSEFEVSAGDYLKIYDGTDNTGTPLWNTTAYGANGLTGNMSNVNFDTTVSAHSGNMYFQWSTNGIGNNRGFIGEWDASPTAVPRPIAKFTCQDTVCKGVPVSFENLSTGDNLNYSWNFDGTGFTQAIDENPTYTFTSTGVIPIRLVVSNCGGDSSYIKNIFVITPNNAPVADFVADITKPLRTIDVVNFTDLSTGCINNWTWQITPTTFSIVSGYPNGTNPRITFNDTGCYNVTLIAGYDTGKDTITKNCYIRPNDYCIPSVTNLNIDLGISRVQVGTIDYTTSSGSVGYSDYASTKSTYLDQYAKYSIGIWRTTAKNAMTRKVWIDWNIDGDFYDAGELVTQEASASTVFFTDTFTVPSNSGIGATRMRVGVCIAGYPNTVCGPNFFGEYEDYRVILRPFSIAPEITLIGPDTLYLNQCDTLTDPGATASSVLFGSMTSQIVVTDNVDPNNAGFYWIKYTVTDSFGNKGSKKRIVSIIQDKVAPQITLLGKSQDTIDVFTSFSDPGVVASDNCSGLQKVDVISTLNSNFLGQFLITYVAYDNNNNTAQLTRTVVVLDRVDPIISLIGKAVDTVDVKSSYTDPGVNYSDNYDKNPQLSKTGSVNPNALGTYSITYTVKDSSGNQVSVYRTVYVVDRTPPSITSSYKDKDTITIDVFTTLSLPMIQVSDNYYSTASLTVTESGTFLSFTGGYADKIGCYSLEYSVMDSSGNMSAIHFTVCVVDRIKPVISLVGNQYINIKRWHTADTADLQYNVTDNYDPSPLVWVTGTYYSVYLKFQEVGFYNIVYHAKDQSGNESDTILRYVNVEPNVGLEEDELQRLVNIYPNPAADEFFVLLQIPDLQTVDVSIFNQLGELIKVIKPADTAQKLIKIDMHNHSAGIYLVKIRTEGVSIVKRLTLTN